MKRLPENRPMFIGSTTVAQGPYALACNRNLDNGRSQGVSGHWVWLTWPRPSVSASLEANYPDGFHVLD